MATSLLNHYRALTKLRQEHPALNSKDINLLETGNSGVYAALRSSGNEKILVLVNLTNADISDYQLRLDENVLPDSTVMPKTLFGSTTATSITVSSGKFSGYKPVDELLPYGSYIFQLN